ncbi:MAG: helix-turn-helix transcriptional regulator [Deltaproteobacteria bacterium]|jgi:predicted XRE-type DNA-binding protein|nr:helix-turn-helix transcriptional regulator [Deltaproteobacteria bacterium]
MKDKVIMSSGNVFADIGLPDAEERLAKAQLAHKISEIIQRRHISQAEAARILGTEQPKISAIMNGKLSGFSLERLIYFLNVLGSDVQIIVKPKPPRRKSAALEVVFA